jgi:hypothetical protein
MPMTVGLFKPPLPLGACGVKYIIRTIVLLSIGYSVSLGLTQANPIVGLIAGLFSGTLFGLAVASLVLLAIGVWRKIFP